MSVVPVCFTATICSSGEYVGGRSVVNLLKKNDLLFFNVSYSLLNSPRDIDGARISLELPGDVFDTLTGDGAFKAWSSSTCDLGHRANRKDL